MQRDNATAQYKSTQSRAIENLADAFDWEMAASDSCTNILADYCRREPAVEYRTNTKMYAGEYPSVLSALPLRESSAHGERAATGILRHVCSAEHTTNFERWLLRGPRDGNGHMIVGGVPRAGFYNYVKIVVPVDHSVQSSRSFVLFGKDMLRDVREVPGLLGIVHDMCAALNLDPAKWLDHVKAVHGLILDRHRQTDFTWHDDVADHETLLRPAHRAVTTVVQCSEALTGMRLAQFEPFYYTTRGDTSIFPALAVHQAIPRKDPNEVVVKVAIFWILPEPLAAEPAHYSCKHGGRELVSAEVMKLVMARRACEFKEISLPVPPGNDCFVNESTVKTLWCMLQLCMSSVDAENEGLIKTYGEPAFYLCYRRLPSGPTTQSELVGIVWHDGAALMTGQQKRRRLVGGGSASTVDKRGPSPCTPNVLCFCAHPCFRGRVLHEMFCAYMQEEHHVEYLHAPLAKCRLQAGGWLRRMGWKNASRTGAGRLAAPKDGDIMVLNIAEREQ